VGNVTVADTAVALDKLARDVANVQDRVSALASVRGLSPEEASALRRQVAAVTAGTDTSGVVHQLTALAELTATKLDAAEAARLHQEALAANRVLAQRLGDTQAALERATAAQVEDASRLTGELATVRGELVRVAESHSSQVGELASQMTTVLTTLRDSTSDVRDVQRAHNALHGRVVTALDAMAKALPHVYSAGPVAPGGLRMQQPHSPSMVPPRHVEPAAPAPSIADAQAAVVSGTATSSTIQLLQTRLTRLEEVARAADTRSTDALAAADAAVNRSARAEMAADACIQKTKQRLARLTGELTALAPVLAAHATSLPAAEMTARTAREEAASAMADTSALATRLGALATAIDSRMATDELQTENIKARLERAEHSTRDLTAALQAVKSSPPPPPPPPVVDPALPAAIRAVSDAHDVLRSEVQTLSGKVESAQAALSRLASATSADLSERPTSAQVNTLVRDATRRAPAAVRELLHRVTALEVAQQAGHLALADKAAQRSSSGSASGTAAAATARVLALRAAAAAVAQHRHGGLDDDDGDST
jgi:hypothetical protein